MKAYSARLDVRASVYVCVCVCVCVCDVSVSFKNSSKWRIKVLVNYLKEEKEGKRKKNSKRR